MALIFVFAFFLFNHLSVLTSAQERYNTRPNCPKSFSCLNFKELEFPFYKSTDTSCGLCKLNFTGPVPKIQLGNVGRFYDFIGFRPPRSIQIHDQELQRLLDNKDCDSLKNLSLPTSPNVSFEIHNMITLLKCLNTSNIEQQRQVFHDYHRCKECKQHNLYYRYPVDDSPIPDGLPNDCSVIQLPLLLVNFDSKASELFSLLTANFSLKVVQLSDDCQKCQRRRGRCHYDEHKSVCANAQDKRSLTLILATVIPGTVIICLVVLIIWWRKKRINFSTYFGSRNSYSDVEDCSSYFGVPVFFYKDLEEATHFF